MEAARDQTFARVDLRAANASERVLWYLTDHLNSVRLVLDEGGCHTRPDCLGCLWQHRGATKPATGQPDPVRLAGVRRRDRLVLQPRPLPRPDDRPLDDPRPAGLRRRGCQPVPLCRQPGHAGHRSEREHPVGQYIKLGTTYRYWDGVGRNLFLAQEWADRSVAWARWTRCWSIWKYYAFDNVDVVTRFSTAIFANSPAEWCISTNTVRPSTHR